MLGFNFNNIFLRTNSILDWFLSADYGSIRVPSAEKASIVLYHDEGQRVCHRHSLIYPLSLSLRDTSGSISCRRPDLVLMSKAHGHLHGERGMCSSLFTMGIIFFNFIFNCGRMWMMSESWFCNVFPYCSWSANSASIVANPSNEISAV